MRSQNKLQGHLNEWNVAGKLHTTLRNAGCIAVVLGPKLMGDVIAQQSSGTRFWIGRYSHVFGWKWKGLGLSLYREAGLKLP